MLVADASGAVHACGLGVGGRLGLGDEAAVVQPVALPRFTTRVVSLACGLDHSVVVGGGGGGAAEGAPLGYQASAPQTTPRRVKFVSSAASSAAMLHAPRRRRRRPHAGGGAGRRAVGMGRNTHGELVGSTRRRRRAAAQYHQQQQTCRHRGGRRNDAVAEDGGAYTWLDHTASRVKLVAAEVDGASARTSSARAARGRGGVRVVAVAVLGSTGLGEGLVWGDALVPRGRPHVAQRVPAVAVAAAQYSTYAVSAAGDAFWDEHWHDAWRPTPRLFPATLGVTICAAEGHCAAVVGRGRRRRPSPWRSPWHRQRRRRRRPSKTRMTPLCSSTAPASVTTAAAAVAKWWRSSVACWICANTR